MLFYSLVILISLIGFGYMHEQVHVAIFEDYGISSHVEYWGHGSDWATVTDEPIPVGKCNETCMLSHNINEAIGYQLMPFFVLVGIGFLMVIGGLGLLTRVIMFTHENKSEPTKQPEKFR